MGLTSSYLSEPVTEKVSADESNGRLDVGSSSMQGWRLSQEDAHNCILDYDANTSLFAVYDGHGGHEVARYTADKLPDFLKAVDSYTKGEYGKALEEAFLGLDATIITRDVRAMLTEIAKEGQEESELESEGEDTVKNLYEEAAMPIEKVIEKYTNKLLHTLKGGGDKDKEVATSTEVAEAVSSSSSGGGCSSSAASSSSDGKVENGVKLPEIRVDSPDSSGDNKSECTPSSNSEKSDEADEKPSSAESKHQNGDVAESTEVKNEDVTSSSNGEVIKKGKGKALTKTKGVEALSPKRWPKRTVKQMYARLLDLNQESEDSEDEEDKTFESPNEYSSDNDEEGVNSMVDKKGDEEESSEEDDDDDDEEDEDEDKVDQEFSIREEPGFQSGCTAVVALLSGDKLYVANAGDSRCIVCRDGKAIEMSIDHKPEDQPEYDRIVKAGGSVFTCGRVNGGLNLSRAIGDHSYKQNKDLSDKEQMITALPDIKTLDINSDDEFMVLACDGIWNFMSSQEVVDFVRPAIKEGKKLSTICEEMFDHCLAPHTFGDGTGCDNMTAIIIQFKNTSLKRSSSPNPDESNKKRAKTEEEAASAPQKA